MKPPIIVNENGAIGFFATVQDAAQSLEAVDVRNGEYRVFDAQGGLITLAATEPLVTLIAPDEPSGHSDELALILRRFFSSVGVDDGWVENASLEQLVSLGLERYLER